MAKQLNQLHQANQYDKIIKENLEVTLPVILKDLLGLDIAQSEELPDDIQHTKERKPDALKKVTDMAGHTFVRILSNFGESDSYAVVKEIIEEVKSHTKGDFAESRNFRQLRILVQLRSNLETQFEKAMETVSKFFKEERDFLYRKGEARGEARKSYEVVENLIRNFDFSDEQAAGAASVSLDFVQQVRAELAKNKK